MKRLLLFLLVSGPCTAGAQRLPPARELQALQDSVWHWLAANRDADPLAEAVYASGTDDSGGYVDIYLMRADSAMKNRFRRCIHDSPLIRLHGFDPDTTPYPPAPEGTAPPNGLTMEAEYALYPTGTGRVQLTIRYRGDQAVYFGTDYTVCRFRHGRWEALPIVNIRNSLLISIGRSGFPPPDSTPRGIPPGGYTYDFTARIAPRVFPAAYARYRICKRVYLENPRRDYLLTADFTVTPFVPFTRFTEDANGQAPRH